MRVRLIPCGPYANESEQKAAEACRAKLSGIQGHGTWILLTNLAHSSNPLYQSDEIDILAIGPQGVFTIDTKHWDAAWMNANSNLVEAEAERLTAKARRVGGRVRRLCPKANRVQQSFLLTRETKPAGA